MLERFAGILRDFKPRGLEFIQRDSRNQFTIITRLTKDDALLVIKEILSLFKET
jgi:hypothetical protein